MLPVVAALDIGRENVLFPGGHHADDSPVTDPRVHGAAAPTPEAGASAALPAPGAARAGARGDECTREAGLALEDPVLEGAP